MYENCDYLSLSFTAQDLCYRYSCNIFQRSNYLCSNHLSYQKLKFISNNAIYCIKLMDTSIYCAIILSRPNRMNKICHLNYDTLQSCLYLEKVFGQSRCRGSVGTSEVWETQICLVSSFFLDLQSHWKMLANSKWVHTSICLENIDEPVMVLWFFCQNLIYRKFLFFLIY